MTTGSLFLEKQRVREAVLSFSCFSVSFSTFTKERGELTSPTLHLANSLPGTENPPTCQGVLMLASLPCFTHSCRLHVFLGLNTFLLRTNYSLWPY